MSHQTVLFNPLGLLAHRVPTVTVFLSAAAAAASFVQEEAVKTEADSQDSEADEGDVEQAADEDQSEDAETEKSCKCLVKVAHLIVFLRFRTCEDLG